MEEMDILEIVKCLRVSKFMQNLALSPYQQQMINYFYEYSLENKLAKPRDWKQYDRRELVGMVNGAIENPIN